MPPSFLPVALRSIAIEWESYISQEALSLFICIDAKICDSSQEPYLTMRSTAGIWRLAQVFLERPAELDVPEPSRHSEPGVYVNKKDKIKCIPENTG